MKVLDDFAIPSTYTLMDAVAARPEERSRFQGKLALILEERVERKLDTMVAYMEGKDDTKKRIEQFRVGLAAHGRQPQINIFAEDL